MNFVDLFSLTLHRAVAERIRLNEAEVLSIARNNLERWLDSESFAGVERFPLLEWKNILEQSTPEEIRKIITAENDEGQRLRSSSPFTGILTHSERERYFNECAQIRPV